MSDPLAHRILKHIADRRYVPRQVRQLAADLGVADQDYDAFDKSIQRMVDDGRVVLSAASTVGLPPPGSKIVGSFRLNSKGFGFVVPESPTEHGDLFIPQGNTATALTGDGVCAQVIHITGRARGGRSPYIGRIVEIIKRADQKYVGNLKKHGSQWVVHVDGKHGLDPIVVRDPQAKDAGEGDKVVLELIKYPDPAAGAGGEGVIVEVLGPHGEPDVETQAVMRAYSLTDIFTDDVLRQARTVSRKIKDAVPAEREDLTDVYICTIDPPDARDFDDAISITRLDDADDGAAYELGVHIADVSHFVTPDSQLDKQAYARGNSAYLPRKVIPMLPELLSNGVCSLQEGVNRYCKSVFVRFDAAGAVVSQRFANTVINSKKRLTYLEAQALIDDDVRQARKHTRSDPKYPRPLIRSLKLTDELARLIRQRRLSQGMIVLGLPDVELVFDDVGNVVDAVPEDNAFTHTIIEMCMVEANEAAARLFDTLNVPMIRRIHADPPAHDMKDLHQFARIAGYNIPLHPTRSQLQALLDRVRGKPAQHAVHLAVLQTLSRAEYSPMLIGHFALASEHYTHFTSPIRRYPDLVVHRALDAYLELAAQTKKHAGKNKTKLAKALGDHNNVPDEPALIEIGRHCSQTERNAQAAEHDLTNYLVLSLLSDCLGDDYAGTVTGITGSGAFIQLDRFLVDGFIHINDLPSAGHDRWRLNRTTGALVAQRSAKTICIGDRFTVRIATVNPQARKLDLVIIDDSPVHTDSGGKKSGKRKRKQAAGAKKAHQKTMKIKRKKKGKR